MSKMASNRTVQRKFREALAEHNLSGEIEPLRQAMLWLLFDSQRPDYIGLAFAAVQINVGLDCLVADQNKAEAEQN